MDSGVPQGTLLGPLLFLLHFNDLPSVFSSKVRLFADDCLIYRNIKNKEDQIALQKYLNLLENWNNTWGMHFEAPKCYIMRGSRTRDPKLFKYSLTGQVLEEVMDAKYLGVTLSDDLEWSKHIATMINKANSKLSFLCRNLKGCPENNNIYLLAQYPANTVCSMRLYYVHDIMYIAIIHDDIVYSLERRVFTIDLKQSIVLSFYLTWKRVPKD